MGSPLTHGSQIGSSSAIARALDALLHGRDELPRDTKAQGWNKYHYGEGEDAMKMWFEELSDIDAVISENVEVPMTPLPTSSLVETIRAAVENLSTWYAAPVPVYQKRALHIHYDELAEVEGDLRTGKINPAEAAARYDAIMADLSQIEAFSNFMVG